jgi:hypothetical protein
MGRWALTLPTIVEMANAGRIDVTDAVGAEQVFVVCAMPPDGGDIYVSLHSTQGGAMTRFADMAEEWGVCAGDLQGVVRVAVVETA